MTQELEQKYAGMGYKFQGDEDVFETAPGFADDFDAVVVEAHFAPDATYNNGQTTLLHLQLMSNDPDVGEQHIMYPLGTGWNSYDGGATVKHDKEKVRFQDKSIIGNLLGILKKQELNDILRKRGFAPFDCRMMLGMVAHWNRVELEYKGANAPQSTSRLFPTKVYRWASEAEIAQIQGGAVLNIEGASGQAAPAAAPTATNPADDAIMGILRTLAQALPYEQWLSAALSNPDVKGNQPLLGRILDAKSGLYESLKG